ncbi:GRAM domain-containing protein YSP2 [Madurella mycetomatis]|uniref:GRAM domain-containing protein YSP2 n=1 Tax=Madurella mycetomatis TaxID=100816 RepID=A0A175VXQ8_9PEZI|nr:GRAM domain-containing protein YSP2 [Madurella mycetomatis]
MDNASNGLGKLLPKAIVAKRRRNKAASSVETTSSNEEVAPQTATSSLASRSTTGSDANSIDGSLHSQGNADHQASCESDPEPATRGLLGPPRLRLLLDVCASPGRRFCSSLAAVISLSVAAAYIPNPPGSHLYFAVPFVVFSGAGPGSSQKLTLASSNRRPTAISPHPSQVGHLTTSSPLVQAAHKPEPRASDGLSNRSVRSPRPPQDSTDSLESAPSLDRSQTTREPTQLQPKQQPSPTSRPGDVSRPEKTSEEALDDGAKPASDTTAHEPVHARPDEPKPSTGSNRRLSRGLKLEPLIPPQTPPAEPSTPLIVNTPPTPTDPQPTSAAAGTRRPADASTTGNMITQRRRTGSSVGPSKLSNITSAPLTPTPENGSVSPGNPAATFFSSMFSAVQNTANTLGATISNSTLAPGAVKTKATPVKEQSEREQPERVQDAAQDAVEVESAAPRPSSEPKEPAVKTLGMGDLSLSQLGIVDAASAAPSPVAGRFAESETRSRSDSAPPDTHAAVAEFEDPASRPRSLNEAAGGERTPPTGSLYEGKAGVHRSGSIRSAIGHRRNRGSSVATHGTGGTIGAAIAAANSSIGNPAASGAPKLTGFAVANKKRNRDFHALFKSVPDDDYLIEDYSCALQREILAHGRLYVSEGHLCFSSNILGWVTTLVMSFDEIVSVEKRSTALVFKNGLEISTLHTKHIFASFASRDTTYDLIIKIWKLGHPHLQSSLNGVRLEEPGGDRTEKIETASVSAVGSHSISGSDVESDDDDDVYDEDEDEEEDQDTTQSDGGAPEPPDKAVPRKVSGPAAPLETSEAGAPAAGGDFPGPAAHAPTDCGDAATHYDKVLGDEVIPAPLGKVYTLLFGPASAAWMGKWLSADQKCTELQMEDKRGLSDDVKSRSYSYIKPLSASIGPKQTKCLVTELLEQIDLEKAVSVLVSTQNPDVPSGNIFVVKTKYCLTWAENNATRVQINCTIEWSGKSWLKAAIERGANDGQTQYCKDLFASLKAAVSSRQRTGALANGAARGKKRARKGKSAQASNLASDAEDVAKAAAKQSWGLFEPARPFLGPVADTIGPILTGNVVYGLLVGLLVASWFGFGARQGAPQYGRDLAYANYPQRMAAYEEMWRREESELWEWLEERVGLERLGSDPPPRKRSADPRTVEERLREERMDERDVKEAIRVTEEHLEVLKSVVDGRRAGR